MPDVLIAFGCNLGDRAAAIARMLAMAAAEPCLAVRRCSSLYETAPVGGPEQGPYLNGALLAQTDLGPRALLQVLQRIENELGRVRTVRWGPRTMDLDLLLYGDRVIDLPDLQVPHPRMAERLFVLVPAAEVAPDMAHPAAATTVAELRDRLIAREGPEAARAAVRLWGPAPGF